MTNCYISKNFALSAKNVLENSLLPNKGSKGKCASIAIQECTNIPLEIHFLINPPIS